jgi:hypothetical protein
MPLAVLLVALVLAIDSLGAMAIAGSTALVLQLFLLIGLVSIAPKVKSPKALKSLLTQKFLGWHVAIAALGLVLIALVPLLTSMVTLPAIVSTIVYMLVGIAALLATIKSV